MDCSLYESCKIEEKLKKYCSTFLKVDKSSFKNNITFINKYKTSYEKPTGRKCNIGKKD